MLNSQRLICDMFRLFPLELAINPNFRLSADGLYDSTGASKLEHKIYLIICLFLKILKAIADIPQNIPNESEGLIRKLYDKRLNLKEEGKEQLQHDLKAVVSRGLQESFYAQRFKKR